MKISEMNHRQKEILIVVKEQVTDCIALMENECMDFCEEYAMPGDAERIEEMERILADRELLFQHCLPMCKDCLTLSQSKNLKFEGNEFLENVVRFWVRKMGFAL